MSFVPQEVEFGVPNLIQCELDVDEFGAEFREVAQSWRGPTTDLERAILENTEHASRVRHRTRDDGEGRAEAFVQKRHRRPTTPLSGPRRCRPRSCSTRRR